jgi:hypothetical protein
MLGDPEEALFLMIGRSDKKSQIIKNPARMFLIKQFSEEETDF